MDPSLPPAAPPPPGRAVVSPDGSLGLLATGYRGLVAWREARGTDWIAALGLPPLPDPEAAEPNETESPRSE